jgi:hypothetical protein
MKVERMRQQVKLGALYVPNFNEMSDAKKQTFGVLAARHIEDMQKNNKSL